MTKSAPKNKISLLCLIIFLMLVCLSLLQKFGLLPLRNWGVMLVYGLIFFLPMLIYTKTRGRKAKEIMRLKKVDVKYFPFILLMGISVCLICGLLNVFGYMLYGNQTTTDQPTALFDFSTQNPLVLLLTMVILPAVTEELLLRGIALSEYEHYGTLRAVLITSLIFALFHANPISMLSLFVAGLCYAVLTLLFNSVWPALIAHLMNNLAALLISYHKEYISYILDDAIFVIVVIVVVFLLLIATLKLLEKVIAERGKRGKLKYLHRRSKQSPWRSISLWIFAAGCITKMLLSYFL